MFGSDVLEVGIGMSLLFLMMSLIATAVREAIEGLMKSRANDLENGLREMLNDVADGNYDGMVGQIYKHPLINSLYRGTLEKAQKGDLPSYIPSKTFVAALLDIVLKSKPAAGGTAKAADALQQGGRQPLTIENLKLCAANLPPEVKAIVIGAIDDAQGDINTVRKNLEGWFDATMDRVSGWYRRRTQLILFLIGIAAAGILNVDSISIAQRLTNDKTLRTGIVAIAQSKGTVPNGNTSESYDQLSERLRNIGFPIGWTSGETPSKPDGTTSKPDGATSKPDGMSWIYPAPQMCPRGTCTFSAAALFQAVVGWLVTAFAIMLGAPFWFDVLNKFMVVRSTVKPSEKSQNEGSKDAAQNPLTFLIQPAAVAPDTQPASGQPGRT